MRRQQIPNDRFRAARERLLSPSGAPRPMSRRELADAVSAYLYHEHDVNEPFTQDDIGRIERGVTRWPGRWRRLGLRAVLGVDSDKELGFYSHRSAGGLPGTVNASSQDRGGEAGEHAGAANGVGREVVADTAVVAVGGAIPVPTRPGKTAEPSLTVEAAMQAFRSADRRLGGSYLYTTVVDYLHTDVAPGLFGGTSSHDRSQFAAAAALTEMAGWMAHDMGQDTRAHQHMSRSLDLVQVANDRQLHAHVLASMAHLADHRSRPCEAEQLARRGLDRLEGGPRDPDLEARLLALCGRSAAATNDAAQCVRLLGLAERALDAHRGETRSPWVNGFDEAALAGEVARCTLRLGDIAETKRQAERVVALRPADKAPRSHALGKLALVSALVAHGEVERACSLAREVLDSTMSLGSVLVIQQIWRLQHQLEHATNQRPAMQELLEHLRAGLRQRSWLHTRLTTGTPRGAR